MEVPKTSDVGTGKTITPEITWAQRSSTSDAERNHIFLTISVPDVDKSKITLDLQATHLDFSGYSATKKATYAVKLEFFGEIDPEKSKINHTSRDIEMVLRKKELKEEYWPRLLKDKVKVHFLKTDFDKWVDEDEQNEVTEDDDYMSRMGGMGGMPGMEGMGGMGGMPGMGGMGGMGGMPGMGGMGGMGGMPGMDGIDFSKLGDMSSMMGGMGGADGDEDGDEDDMPELEGEGEGDEGAAAAKGKGKAAPAADAPASSKIEEIE